MDLCKTVREVLGPDISLQRPMLVDGARLRLAVPQSFLRILACRGEHPAFSSE
jgi:hypothetical protein